MSEVTPYQGDKRVFGEFKCPQCNRHWQSGNTWKNSGQMCETCKIMVYPHTQRQLERSQSKIDLNKPHPQHLCGKCQALGHPCN